MELPKRKNIRLPSYDYTSNGAYFITICTKDRQKILSRIRRGGPCGRPLAEVTALGRLAENQLLALETRFAVAVDSYVIMPDHIHMILFQTGERAAARAAPTTGQVIGAYKSLVVREWRTICNAQNRQMGTLWQRGYFEHVIRNQQDLDETRAYIEGNPTRWIEKYTPQGQPLWLPLWILV